MEGLLAKFVAQLIIILGDYLVSQGAILIKDWVGTRMALEKAAKYEKIGKDPNSSIDDKLRAGDDFGH